MIHNKFRYLITLALLLTAVTGAWAAEETLLTTVTATGHTSYSQSPDGIVTVTLNNINSYHYTYGWLNGGSVTVEAAQGYTITRCVFKQNPNSFPNRVLVDDQAPFTATMLTNMDGGTDVSAATSTGDVIGDDFMNGISSIEVYGTAEPPIEVTPGEAANTWTFSMPGSDVELTPIYAPVAKWAVIDEVSQEPKAAEGVIAGTDAALITGGTVAKATDDDEAPLQGTAKFFVTTDEEMTAEQALAANGWLSTPPTAAAYDEATTVYVWYYIEGADTPEGDDPTAENTFNNTDICAEPLEVSVLSNKFDIALKAANALTIDATEASKGTISTKTGDSDAEDKTADIDEEGKLKQVKMGSEVKLNAKTGYKFRKVEVKKGAGKTITIGDMELTYADGDTWETIVSKNSDKIKTLSGRIVQVAQPAPNTYKYIHVWYTTVKPSDIIDPSKNYQWGTLEVNF